jgi:hypothetical protein
VAMHWDRWCYGLSHDFPSRTGGVAPGNREVFMRALVDSRGVEVPMVYNPTCVMLSSLEPSLFKSLKKGACFTGNAGA